MGDKFYSGIVKSYNIANGYGFIECAETKQMYGNDVFLHKNEFTASGVEVGQDVRFRIMISDKGQPRAIAMQDSFGNPLGPQNGVPNAGGGGGGGMGMKRNFNQFQGGGGMGGSGRFFGQIRNFNQEKGFGFIESEQIVPTFGGSDVFLHYTEALNFRVGDFVTFEVSIGEGGKPQARALQLSNQNMMGGGMMGGGMMQGGGFGGGGGKGKGKGKKQQAQFNPNKEFQGVVKSYNMEKGYGFIECQETKEIFQRDVYIDTEQITSHSVEVGEEVTFTIKLNSKTGNPQGILLGKSTQLKEDAEAKLMQCGQGPHTGIIKSYNEGKGFGFIECAETFSAFNQDVFLHKKEMPSVEHVGAEVQFSIMLNARGQPQATNVEVIGAGVQAAVDGGDQFDAANGNGDVFSNQFANGDVFAGGDGTAFDATTFGEGGEFGEEPAAKRIKV